MTDPFARNISAGSSHVSALATIVRQQVLRARTQANNPTDNETINEVDLDQQVAELILREAAEKRQRYETEGVAAYYRRGPGSLPRTDKRFLVNVIRQVDSHNQAVLRRELQASRTEHERRDRYHSSDKKYRSPKRTRSSDRSTTRSSRDRAITRHRSLSRSPSRDARLRQQRASTQVHHHSPLASPTQSKSTGKKPESRSPSPTSHRSNESTVIFRGRGQRTIPETGTLGRNQTTHMDRYFRDDYDPRLDIADSIPMEGMVPDFGDLLAYASSSKKKTHKKKEKHKKKSHSKSKRKHKSDTSEDDTSTDEEYERRRHRKKRKRKRKKSSKKRSHRRRDDETSSDMSSSDTMTEDSDYDEYDSDAGRHSRTDASHRPSHQHRDTRERDKDRRSRSPGPAPVREWDIAKLAGEWDPERVFAQTPR